MPVLMKGQEHRIDSPIRLAADHVGRPSGIGGPDPWLTPWQRVALFQRLDDLLGNLVSNLFLGSHWSFLFCDWLVCRYLTTSNDGPNEGKT